MTGPNHVYHYKHGWIPIDSYAANIKRQKTLGSAGKLAAKAGHAPSGHVEEDPKLTTLVNLRELGHPKYEQVLAKHQAEHGAKSSAEKVAAAAHTAPEMRRETPAAKASSTAERIAARALSHPSATGARDDHVAAAAMERGKLPQDMRPPMASALSHQAKFPGLVEHLSEIRLRSGSDAADGRYEHRLLHVAPDIFDPNSEFTRSHQARAAVEKARGGATYLARVQAETDGRVSPGDVVVAHEMGHAVEAMIGNKGKLEAMTAAARVAGLPLPTPVMRHWNDGGPDTVDDEATLDKWVKSKPVKRFLTRELSVYGTSNILEASAEIWSVYSLDGNKAPPWIRAFGDSATALLRQKAGQ